jgi:hypothetical protein
MAVHSPDVAQVVVLHDESILSFCLRYHLMGRLTDCERHDFSAHAARTDYSEKFHALPLLNSADTQHDKEWQAPARSLSSSS